MSKRVLGYVKTVPSRDAYTLLPYYTVWLLFETKPTSC